MIITLKGANFSASNIGTLSSWRITRSLGSGATYNGVTSVDKGASFSATVTISEGYELGTAGVTVTMGGTVLSGAHSISGNVITITIAEVTGNVLIKVPTVNTATGEEEEPEEPDVPSVLTLYKSTAANGMFMLDYQDAYTIQSNTPSKNGKFQLVGVDVSDYVGKTLSITATQAIIEGASYTFFTNELAGGYALDTIPSLQQDSLPTKTSSGRQHVLDDSIIVEKFVVSTEDKKTNTVQKVVPSNAKYLYFTNLTVEQTSEPSVVVV